MEKVSVGQNFARFRLGEIEVIALRDGFIDMPTSRLRLPGDRQLGSDLPNEIELIGGKLRLSVNAFLIIARGEHILIDTGASNSWEPTMGLFLEALKEAGVDRGDIFKVALTHTHEDHGHGLVAPDSTDAFPNMRTLLVPKEEVPLFDLNERLGRFRDRRVPLTDGYQITPNVTAMAAHGHEIGHTAYSVTSGDELLLIWGDIIHVPSVQFARPEITWGYDANQNEARDTRIEILQLAARPNVYVAGAHLDFPGVGKVTKHNKIFSFAPS